MSYHRDKKESDWLKQERERSQQQTDLLFSVALTAAMMEDEEKRKASGGGDLSWGETFLVAFLGLLFSSYLYHACGGEMGAVTGMIIWIGSSLLMAVLLDKFKNRGKGSPTSPAAKTAQAQKTAPASQKADGGSGRPLPPEKEKMELISVLEKRCEGGNFPRPCKTKTGGGTMNEVIQAMEERRSIRQFSSAMPARALIEQVIEAGLYAPSGRGKQAVIILAVVNRQMRDRLAELNRTIGGWGQNVDPFYGAPVILIVLGDKSIPTHVYDGSLVMGNLMLAAHSLGLGSIWIHRAKEEFEQLEYQTLLKSMGIQGDWEGIGHCAIGYTAGPMPQPAPRKEGRVFWLD